MGRNLSGRKLVITGAARGTGEKGVHVLPPPGVRVWPSIGLEPDRLRALADDLGAGASWRQADVRDGVALRSVIDSARIRHGGIEIAVANAGSPRTERCGKPTRSRSSEFWISPPNGVPHAQVRDAASWESRGHVMVGGVGDILHAACRAGLDAASRPAWRCSALAYRQEVVHLGMTVGLVDPSWIDTDPSEAPRPTCPHLQELRGLVARSGQHHHQCRPGRRRDRPRTRAAQPRYVPRRRRRRQLGQADLTRRPHGRGRGASRPR